MTRRADAFPKECKQHPGGWMSHFGVFEQCCTCKWTWVKTDISKKDLCVALQDMKYLVDITE